MTTFSNNSELKVTLTDAGIAVVATQSIAHCTRRHRTQRRQLRALMTMMMILSLAHLLLTLMERHAASRVAHRRARRPYWRQRAH